MDVTAALVQHLLASPSVTSKVGQQVFGESIPVGAEPPLVLVRSVIRIPFTRPTTVWWKHTIAVDCHSTDPGESHDISEAVEKAVDEWNGVDPTGVIANSQVENTSLFEDGSFTPTRYRNVVTVAVTARD